MPDPLNLEEIEARLKAATPGPWKADTSNDGSSVTAATACYTVCDCADWVHPTEGEVSDARLIAHAPTDLAALVAEVRRLRELEHMIPLASAAVAVGCLEPHPEEPRCGECSICVLRDWLAALTPTEEEE